MSEKTKKWINVQMQTPVQHRKKGVDYMSRIPPSEFLNEFPDLADSAKIYMEPNDDRAVLVIFTDMSVEEVNAKIEALAKRLSTNDGS